MDRLIEYIPTSHFPAIPNLNIISWTDPEGISTLTTAASGACPPKRKKKRKKRKKKQPDYYG